MTEQISEVAIHYRSSSRVHSYRKHPARLAVHRVQAGDRAPDVKYADDHGSEHRFHHLLQCPQHTVFVFSAQQETRQALEQHLQAWRCRESFVLYCVDAESSGGQTEGADWVMDGDAERHTVHEGSRLTGYTMVSDPNHAIANRYHLSQSSILIIRPDGYVGFLSDTVEFPQVRAYVERVFML